MSTFHQRSTCHLHKLQVLKPDLWPWRPSLPLRNDLCIQKCALRLQAVELLKFSPRGTKHVPCSWLAHHPWCQANALGSALVFCSRHLSCQSRCGESMELGCQPLGPGPDLATRNVRVWVSSIVSRPPRPTWHMIIWALKHLWLYAFTTKQDNATLLHSIPRASLEFYWLLENLENITLQKIVFDGVLLLKISLHPPSNKSMVHYEHHKLLCTFLKELALHWPEHKCFTFKHT